jgi:hypothetical protein
VIKENAEDSHHAADVVCFDVTGNSTPDSTPVRSINVRWLGEVASRKARTSAKEEVSKAIGSSS